MANRDTQTAATGIRGFYELGVRVLKADKYSTKRGTGRRRWGVYEAVHDATGAARDKIEKARRFASIYSRAELKELCVLGGRRGKPINKSHVIRLLGVANKRRRAKLARMTSEQGWSVRRLSDEIWKTKPKRRSGGRRPRVPQTVADAIVDIERMTGQWARWCEALEAAEDDEDTLHRETPALVVIEHDSLLAEFLLEHLVLGA